MIRELVKDILALGASRLGAPGPGAGCSGARDRWVADGAAPPWTMTGNLVAPERDIGFLERIEVGKDQRRHSFFRFVRRKHHFEGLGAADPNVVVRLEIEPGG